MKKEIYRRIRDFIAEQNLLEKNDRVLLSMSAGKDSIFLFHLFQNLSSDIPLEFEIFHLNHMTRGANSDLDEKLTVDLAANNHIPIHLRRHVFDTPSSKGISFEDEARRVRYHYLEEIAAVRNCTKIATGHNRNDNIETVIMRIFSGTGLHGLAGIAPSRGKIIRPLLCLTSSEIVSALEDMRIKWREDESNLDRKYLRNFIRHEIIPPAEERFPSLFRSVENLGKTADGALRMMDKFVALEYDIRQESGDGYFSFEPDRLINDRDAFFHVISAGFRKAGGYPSVKILDEIWRTVNTNKANLQLYKNSGLSVEKRLIGKRQKIIISKKTALPRGEWSYFLKIESEMQQIVVNEAGITIVFKMNRPETAIKMKRDDADAIFIDPGESSNFIIRNRRDGDRITLNFGTKKIKNLLIDSKIDPVTRTRVPLVEIDGQIAAYLPGFADAGENRIAEPFRVSKTSKKVLAIYRDKNFHQL